MEEQQINKQTMTCRHHHGDNVYKAYSQVVHIWHDFTYRGNYLVCACEARDRVIPVSAFLCVDLFVKNGQFRQNRSAYEPSLVGTSRKW